MKCILSVALNVFAIVSAATAADDRTVLPARLDGVAPGHMMHAYWMRQAELACDRHDAEYEKLKTPEQCTAYQQRMRRFFLDQLGPFPPRTPLSARVVGRRDGDGYRMEKIIFESQPRHFVTAVFYLPNGKPPLPGVLFPCGHSANGKADAGYQRACILLARNGLAVLCYDPIDQGERAQLLDEKGKAQAVGTVGHGLTGVGSILLGRNTATFRVWDGMRAIDYLQSRPEVDPRRIGCTGNSGGGTLTSYLMALDDRIHCAAPGCYITSMRRLMETIGPQDAEQNIHAQLAYGLGHAEYVMLHAPHPTLLCTATHDFFDIGGTWDTFRQAKRFYGRLGFAERVDLIETDEKHGFSTRLRVGATRWMRRWMLGIDDAIVEPPVPTLSNREMQCTPDGQVMRLPGARSVYDLNREADQQLSAERKKLWQGDRAKALDEVRRISGIRKLAALPPLQCEKTGTLARDGYRIDKLILRPEPGIWLPALLYVPREPKEKAYVYVDDSGKTAPKGPARWIDDLVQQGHIVLAVDLRGLGETQGGKPGGYAKNLGLEWADASLAYMLDTSYLAKRAEDILVCARFLAADESPTKPRPVGLVSVGRTGPPALHAAALEPGQFDSVELYHCLTSWSDVVREPMAVNQYVNVVHGALRVYDLPDLLASLGKKVKVMEPLTPREQPAWK